MKKWLNDKTLYIVYPSSFKDGNDDGMGDLKGIIEKLDYLKWLGIDYIWFAPFFKSTFKDGGYDVVDYCQIDPRHGTNEELEELVKEAHKRGLKVILDMVFGHTSMEHPWFKESTKPEHNKYSDYYIWTDNIFNSYQGKTIHGFFDRDGGYYFNYYACQPALNFGFSDINNNADCNSINYCTGESWKMHYTDPRLEPLRQELINVLLFWLGKGVDGFRFDMAHSLVKGGKFYGDAPEDSEGSVWVWDKIMTAVKAKYPDCVWISEWVCPTNAVGKAGFDIDYIAHDVPEFNSLCRHEKNTNLLSVFELGENYFSKNGKGDVMPFIKYMEHVNDVIGKKGFFSTPTGTHDEIRLSKNKDFDVMKTIYAFLLTIPHIPFLYYGDEIGMVHNYSVSREGGFIRCGARTPMQWDNSLNRGFSKATENVYLPTDNIPEISVESQQGDENSLLNNVRRLLALRKNHKALFADSEFKVISCENGGYPLVFERKCDDETVYVVINPSDKEALVNIKYNEVLASNNCSFDGDKINVKCGYAIVK